MSTTIITTKAQEREALQKIREILSTLESDSYIRMAITDNVLRMAEENIEFDFGNSPDDAIEHWQKTASDYREELFTVKEELQKKAEGFDSMARHANKCELEIAELQGNLLHKADEYNTLQEEYDALEYRVRELENENIRLKAKLYDMMTATK